MRSTIIGLLLGCGLIAAASLPAAACPFSSTQASDEQTQPPAQTADAHAATPVETTNQ